MKMFNSEFYSPVGGKWVLMRRSSHPAPSVDFVRGAFVASCAATSKEFPQAPQLEVLMITRECVTPPPAHLATKFAFQTWG